jgi:hypothetical protein
MRTLCCPVCRSLFDSPYPRAKYCSKLCSKTADIWRVNSDRYIPGAIAAVEAALKTYQLFEYGPFPEDKQLREWFDRIESDFAYCRISFEDRQRARKQLKKMREFADDRVMSQVHLCAAYQDLDRRFAPADRSLILRTAHLRSGIKYNPAADL